MHWIDVSIFVLYMVAMLGIGFFFMRKNTSTEDYYVGGRTMNKWHVGLSVVATDVGGGFSIGLGGLGFTMGLSGSWMLFTGLLGAWLSAVMIIPRVSKLSQKVNLLTFPQVFEHLFDRRVAFIAGIISAIGYLGFTSSQILAGAKLASATFPTLSMNQALILLGVIAVTYTVLGGLKAVIYTDTVQWAVLMAGLVFIGIPLGLDKIGGWDAVRSTLSAEYIEFDNLSWVQLANWGITIIPIWFVGMTLYQRIYSCRNHKEAQRAWFIAGLFEWPVMALMGVALGLFARVGFEQGMFGYLGYESAGDLDPEMGLPLFLRTILPVGLMGLMMSAYFSAIMSTADSCLMAASGSTVTDLLSRFYKIREEKQLRISQIATLVIGVLAILIATRMTNVLDLMLLSYSVMVSGLLVPVIGGFFWKRSTTAAAIAGMIGGGGMTIFLNFTKTPLPFELDPNFFGILTSAVLYIIISLITSKTIKNEQDKRSSEAPIQTHQ